MGGLIDGRAGWPGGWHACCRPIEQHHPQMHWLAHCLLACLSASLQWLQVINCGHASTRQYLLQVLHFWAAVRSCWACTCNGACALLVLCWSPLQQQQQPRWLSHCLTGATAAGAAWAAAGGCGRLLLCEC